MKLVQPLHPHLFRQLQRTERFHLFIQGHFAGLVVSIHDCVVLVQHWQWVVGVLARDPLLVKSLLVQLWIV